jgi:xylulokinase
VHTNKYVIGIDIGTSSAKVALVAANGALRRIHTAAYSISSPKPGWAELGQDDWWNAVLEGTHSVMHGIDPRLVAGIGLSTAGGSVVLVDKENRVLRPIVLWLDARSIAEGASLERNGGTTFWRERTGIWALSYSVVAKLKWIESNEPAVLEKALSLFQTADYMVYRLTGQRCLDRSNACSNGLYNLHTRTWDREILDRIGLAPSLLPTLGDPGTVAGGLSEEAACATGLPSGTPVVLGAWDQCCATLGAGATSQGQGLLSAGTAWVLCRPSMTLHIDPQARVSTVQHAVPDEYLMMSAMSNGGSVVEWYRSAFGVSSYSGQRRKARLPDNVDKIDPGSGGLLMLPHLIGATAPHWQPDYSGCILGIRTGTTAEQIFRAILEAVAFEVRWNLSVHSEMGERIESLLMVGGATKSPFWPQIVADVTNVPVHVPVAQECAVLGAATMAQQATGVEVQQDTAGRAIERSYLPARDACRAYDRLYGLYGKAFADLRESMLELSRFAHGAD